MTEEKKPLLIQIDDLVREMTPEETAEYEAFCATAFRVPDPE
jgi:hypothetical protein